MHGTPVDSIDFLLQKILTQAVDGVPANLVDATEATLLFDEINALEAQPHTVRRALSLDVVNLYPSLDTSVFTPRIVDHVFEGLDECVRSERTLGLCRAEVMSLLHFVCNNYEVSFNDITYKQVFGVPMGARFAPPYAIIAMHLVERGTLVALSDLNILLYKRYIDDIVVIFEAACGAADEVTTRIFDTFNEASPGVRFTLEAPQAGGELPFLDMSLSITHNGLLRYSWYQKSTHSGFMMHRLSFYSFRQKLNFMTNRFVSVFERCNNDMGANVGVNKIRGQLEANGYAPIDIRRAFQAAIFKFNQKREDRANGVVAAPKKLNLLLASNSGVSPIKLPFLSDLFTTRVKKLITQLNLPFVLITARSKQIKDVGFSKPSADKCVKKCQVCPCLPKKAHCKLANVVYEATCKLCKGTYIGKTSSSLYNRLTAHKFDLTHGSPSGPLSQHLLEHDIEHANLDSFDWKVVLRGNTPIDTSIKESMAIRWFEPDLNRKEENTFLF